jgi:Pyruvate/2-oxoacid:ferredoxin oxidoreductase delta subunit
MHKWFSLLSARQRLWLIVTVLIMAIIFCVVVVMHSSMNETTSETFTTDMSIQDIAPKLGVTGKALARELNLDLDVPKIKPLKELGIKKKTLDHAVEHLLSHKDSSLKYYIFAALVFGGLIFLVKLGRPDRSDVKNRRDWYPRTPYVLSLFLSVIIAGFFLGKSPNPMEGVVKIFKSMVGLYPDPMAKAIAFLFFIVLAVVANKMICGWACPFGSLQELIYSIPILRRIKQRKLPFVLTNTIRAALFALVLLFLFGIIGGRKGTVIYHQLNPFNLFNLDFETVSILLTVILASLGSFIVYPFGFISWIAERFSIIRVRIDKDKCTECGVCIKACPLEAAKGRVYDKRLTADCFSCARCLNVCPVDAIQYTSVFKNA